MKLNRLTLFILFFSIVILVTMGCNRSCDTFSSETKFTEDQNRVSNISETQLIDDNTLNLSSEFNQLDSEYEQKISAASSNYELCEVNDAYAEKWSEIIDKYYEKLIDISGGRLEEQLVKDRETWIEYALASVDAHFSFYEMMFNGGTMAPVAASQYKYDLYREKALELYDMLTQIEYPEDDSNSYGLG